MRHQSRALAASIVLLLCALDELSAPESAFAASRSADAQRGSTTPPARTRPARKPLLEHQDHRMLPIGTRLYRDRDGTFYVYPGKPLPARLKGRTPDVIIVK
jgi:hypothetical protein